MATEFDATEGQYWKCLLPNGKIGAFWSHPEMGDYHRLVAEFSDPDVAASFIDTHNDQLEMYGNPMERDVNIPVTVPPRVRKGLPPGKYTATANRILELTGSGQSGMTIRELIDEDPTIGSYAHVAKVCSLMHEEGLAIWKYPDMQKSGAKKIYRP